jgi:hypothetical protein
MIRSRIRTFDQWIRIQEAQKHADPADPVPDPQHWFTGTSTVSPEGEADPLDGGPSVAPYKTILNKTSF